MKMIKRIELGSENLLSTTATPDQYPQWAPEGRDFSSGFYADRVAAGGDVAFLISSVTYSGSPSPYPAQLRYHNLDTGERVDTPMPSIDIIVIGAAVSPTGDHVAFSGPYDDAGATKQGLRVYDITDIQNPALVFSARTFEAPTASTLSWSGDGHYLAFPSSPDFNDETAASIYQLDIATLVAAKISPSPADLASEPYTYDYLKDENWRSLASNTDGSVVWGLCRYSDSTSQTGEPAGSHVVRCDVAGQSYIDRELATTLNEHKEVAYVDTRGHLLVSRDYNYVGEYPYSIIILDAEDLTDSASTIDITEWVRIMRVAPDGSEIVVGRSDQAVRRFSTSNYTESVGIDSVAPVAVWPVDYSTAYYVCARDDGGFLLVQRADDAVVTEVNPVATTGEIYTYNDHNYRAILENQDRPDVGAQLETPTWVDLGAINSLRLFDGKIGTVTASDSDLVMELSVDSLADGIAFFGLRARTLRVTLIADGSTVYDTGEVSLVDSSGVDGWYSHFFSERGLLSDYVISSLPPYKGAIVRVELTSAGSSTEIGELVLGRVKAIGDTVYGLRAGITDWSRKDRDEFGNYSITERDYSKRAEYPVSVRTNRLAAIQKMLAEQRSTPAVYIGSDDRPETILYGFFSSFDIVLEGPVYSECIIEGEGLT
jgi:hypothetical protein